MPEGAGGTMVMMWYLGSRLRAPLGSGCRRPRRGKRAGSRGVRAASKPWRGATMDVRVVGAGVGRTGAHSLKLALEQLLGAPCHHRVEIRGPPTQARAWIDAIEGRPVDWSAMLGAYGAIVDWPGGAFWPELSAAFPHALVLLSVRDPEGWYRS